VPSQKQVRWSELRVGLTVLVALVTLGALIFLMTATTGLFTAKLNLHAYLDNAGGLRPGAPVRLEGVDIGNVSSIRVDPTAEHRLAPVRITMKITTKYATSMNSGCQVNLTTAGVLGEVFIDLDCRSGKGNPLKEDDTLATKETPQLQDVVRASQSTLENVNSLVERLNGIVSYIQSGQGSIGKVIYDPTLYERANATIAQLQQLATELNSNQGTVGKLLNSDELYQKLNASVDNLNKIIDEVNSGNGTVGKFLKDPALYENANKLVANGNHLVDDINAGKGTIGKLAKDEALAQKIDNTITRLNSIADRIDKGEGSAGKLINDPALYDNSNKLVIQIQELMTAIRKNPKQYLTIRLKVF